MNKILMHFILISLTFVVGCATATIRQNPTINFSKFKKVVVVNSTWNIGGKDVDAIAGELLAKGLQVVDYRNTYDFIAQKMIKEAKEVIDEEKKSKWQSEKSYNEIRDRYLSLLKQYYEYLGVDAIIEAGFADVYTARVIDVHTGTIVATVQSGNPYDNYTSWNEEKHVAARRLGNLFW